MKKFYNVKLFVLAIITGCITTQAFAQNSILDQKVSAPADNIDQKRKSYNKQANPTKPSRQLPPANDECAAPVNLTVGAACSNTVGDATAATQSLAPVACNGGTSSTANDVWFSFTANAPDQTIRVQGISDYDAVVELFSSCGGASLGCSDDPFTATAIETINATGLTANNTYYVRVYDWNGASTNKTFNICVFGTPPPPANDACLDATLITHYATTAACTPTNVSTISATQEGSVGSVPDTISCAPTSSDDDVWYKFTATETIAIITATNLNGMTNVGMALFESSCAGTEMACDFNTGPTQTLTVDSLQIGTQYLLGVFSQGAGNNGTFDLCVTAPPQYDANLIDVTSSEFSKLTLLQVTPQSFSADVLNSGINTITNIKLIVDVKLAANTVYKDSVTLATLAPGDTATMNIASTFTPTSQGVYNISYAVKIAEAEGDLTNNAISVDSALLITDSVIARHNGIRNGSLAIGATASGVLGQTFTLAQTDTVTSISFYVDTLIAGDTISASIYSHTTTPGSILASTDTIIVAANSTATWVTLPFSQPLTLNAGTYLSGINEGFASSLPVATTSGILTPNTNWVFFNSTWTSLSTNPTFAGRVFMIQTNLGKNTGVSVSDNSLYSNINVYPVPASNSVTVDFKTNMTTPITINLISINGSTIVTERLQNYSGIYSKNLDLNGLAKGVYLLQITTYKEVVTRKITLQ